MTFFEKLNQFMADNPEWKDHAHTKYYGLGEYELSFKIDVSSADNVTATDKIADKIHNFVAEKTGDYKKVKER